MPTGRCHCGAIAYRFAGDAIRYFCGHCGTGLYYVNQAYSPGMIDIQTATLDDPAAYPPDKHVQIADAVAWEADLPSLPTFARFPSGSD